MRVAWCAGEASEPSQAGHPIYIFFQLCPAGGTLLVQITASKQMQTKVIAVGVKSGGRLEPWEYSCTHPSLSSMISVHVYLGRMSEIKVVWYPIWLVVEIIEQAQTFSQK